MRFVCMAALISILFTELIAAGATSSFLHMAPPIRGLKPADLRDTFNEIHGGHRHEAIAQSPSGNV